MGSFAANILRASAVRAICLHTLPSHLCRYCAGTMPWGNTGDHRDFEPQRHDDGCIEVIGFTMASLVSGYLMCWLCYEWAEHASLKTTGLFNHSFCGASGSTAGRRSRRATTSVQGSDSHHLQNHARASGWRAMSPGTIHASYLAP